MVLWAQFYEQPTISFPTVVVSSNRNTKRAHQMNVKAIVKSSCRSRFLLSLVLMMLPPSWLGSGANDINLEQPALVRGHGSCIRPEASQVSNTNTSNVDSALEPNLLPYDAFTHWLTCWRVRCTGRNGLVQNNEQIRITLKIPPKQSPSPLPTTRIPTCYWCE